MGNYIEMGEDTQTRGDTHCVRSGSCTELVMREVRGKRERKSMCTSSVEVCVVPNTCSSMFCDGTASIVVLSLHTHIIGMPRRETYPK